MEDSTITTDYSLFHSDILDAHVKEQPIPPEHQRIIHEWVANISLIETQDSAKQRAAFIENILCGILGYLAGSGQNPHTLEEKTKEDAYFDVRLGQFPNSNSSATVLVKLAGLSNRNSDTIAPEQSLLDQSREKAKEIPGAQFLIISNLDEIRFYSLNRKQNICETFSLRAMINDPAEYERFYLILNAENILSGQTTQWMHESAFILLHDKLTKNHPTLKEVYGALNPGITTGLNDAFIIDQKTYAKLIQDDPKSEEILKPFLKSGDLDRWVPKSRNLWLIYTPKGQVDIDLYPAIKAYLLNFKEQLEKRTTQQKWFELDDNHGDRLTQAAQPKIGFAHKSRKSSFAWDNSGALYQECSYFTTSADYYLSGLINSTTLWKLISQTAIETPDGLYELHIQHIEKLPIPDADSSARAKIGRIAHFCQETAKARHDRITHFCGMTAHNFSKPGESPPLSDKLQKWVSLDFDTFRKEIIAVFGQDIPEKDLDLWRAYFEQEQDSIHGLNTDLEHYGHQINVVVYDIFKLNEDEIAFIEQQ